MAPKKAKKKTVTAAKIVKSIARQVLGPTPPTRTAPARKKPKTEKHKPTLGNLLSSEE